MKEWLSGYEYMPVTNWGISDYIRDDNLEDEKHVLHTTEGGSVGSNWRTYQQTGGIPHFTIDPKNKRKAQHIPLTKAARALLNKPGGVETNRDQVVQTEIVGRAAEASLWTDDQLRFIGEHVRDVRNAGANYKLVPPPKPFVGPPTSTISHAMRGVRLSNNEWDNGSFVCGHQHVPENDHWDPGCLNITKILEYAGGNSSVTFKGGHKVFDTAYSHASGRMEQFRLKGTRAVESRWQTAINGPWSPWAVVLPRIPIDAVQLSASVNQDGRIQVFVLDSSGKEFSIWQIAAGAKWNTAWGQL